MGLRALSFKEERVVLFFQSSKLGFLDLLLFTEVESKIVKKLAKQ